MKISDYAKKLGISYKTVWRWFKDGKIKGYKMPSGTVIITENDNKEKQRKVVIYARVSSSENRANLETQSDRLALYCTAKGWQIDKIIKEIGSGVNDKREKLLKLLKDDTVTHIVVEHKDRLTRFGFNYIETLFSIYGRHIEVVNMADNCKEDLLQDLVSIIYSFCARLYGQRRAKRKTEQITKDLLITENSNAIS